MNVILYNFYNLVLKRLPIIEEVLKVLVKAYGTKLEAEQSAPWLTAALHSTDTTGTCTSTAKAKARRSADTTKKFIRTIIS